MQQATGMYGRFRRHPLRPLPRTVAMAYNVRGIIRLRQPQPQRVHGAKVEGAHEREADTRSIFQAASP